MKVPWVLELLKIIEKDGKVRDDECMGFSHKVGEVKGICGQYTKIHVAARNKQGCGHDTLVVIRCRDGWYHWGQEVCPKCGLHQRWISFKEGKKNYGGV